VRSIRQTAGNKLKSEQQMNIEESQVTKLLLTNIKDLDAITVTLEDLGPRQGKINIDCYGQAWSAYWGGMGSRNIREFFCSCDEHYLAKNLSDIRGEVPDFEGIPKAARAQIVDLRKEGDLTKDKARELYEDATIIVDEYTMRDNHDFMLEVFGDDWGCSIPDKPNDNYVYLCRVINAVKDALKEQAASIAA
jgi:hypothetical protein